MKHLTNNQNTKRLFCFVLHLCIFLFTLCGCGLKSKTSDNGFSVVTVNFVQYDFARAVMGSDENLTMIMKPGAQIHSFEPSLSDIESIKSADVFIYNGGESDAWIEKVFESVDTKSTKKVALMDYAMLIEEHHSGHSHSHSHNHTIHSHEDESDECNFKFGYDEHIWTSPKNAIIMVDEICTALCSANPEMADVYRKNADEYISQISMIDETLKDITDRSKSKFIAVGDRFPFLYLASEYGLEYMAAFPGCSHENDASPSVIIDIIETMKEKNIKHVFYTESSDKAMTRTIKNETGAKELMLHSCQTVSQKDFEKGITYTDIMKENAKNLKEALN